MLMASHEHTMLKHDELTYEKPNNVTRKHESQSSTSITQVSKFHSYISTLMIWPHSKTPEFDP